MFQGNQKLQCPIKPYQHCLNHHQITWKQICLMLTCDLNTNFHAQNTLNNQQKKEPNYIVIFTSGHSDVTKATQTWTQTETQSISTNFIPHKLEEKPKSNRSKQTYMSPMRPVSPTTTVSNASSFLHMHSKSPS
eukprot:902005_1